MDEAPAVVRRYLSAYNAIDLSGIEGCLHSDVVFINCADGIETHRTAGSAEFMRLAREGSKLFKQRRQRILECIASQERCAISVAFDALIAAELNGAGGEQVVRMTGRSFFSLRGGRIHELVDVY